MINHSQRTTSMCAIMCGLIASFIADSPAAEARKPVPPVIAAEAKSTPFEDRIEALGTLRANESVEIKANVAEQVTEIAFDDGQRVKKGDLLVKMLAVEEEALIVEAQSTANEARQQYERVQQLARTGASAVASLDESRRIFETAKARLGAIESRLTDLRILAPFDGIVGLRNISIGARLQPGDMITTLDDDRVMKLDFSIPSTFIEAVRPGVPIKAQARGFGKEPFSGEITSVSSRVDPVTRSIVVRAEIPNPERKLLPGLLMTVEILTNQRKSVTIPEEALMPLGSGNSVFVIDESQSPAVVANRVVEIGTRRAGEVEIFSGLAVGEKVVVRGDMTLTDGAAVSIMAMADSTTKLSEMLPGNADSTPDSSQ